MPSDESKKTPSQLAAIGIVWEILFSIALPTIFFAWLGRTLDTRWGTSPLLTILGLLLALALSGIIVYRKGKRLAKDMNDDPS